MPQFGEGAGFDVSARADDGDRIAEFLRLGQDVAREQHRPPLALEGSDLFGEDGLHQRIESGGRFVKQEQFSLRRQRGDQGNLLPVSFGIASRLLRRVKFESLQQLRPPLLAAVSGAHPGEEVDDLAAGEVRP